MDVGIGLPSTIPDASGRQILDWARAGEEAGFSSLGTIDRVVYGNHETVPTLAAAAAVTSRIRLTTAILIAPLRGNGALLAKQLASVDSFASGRLTVGIAVGGREDDYLATSSDFGSRGQAFDAQLREMAQVWAGESRGTSGAIGPAPAQASGPPLLIGGNSEAAIRRTVEHGAGWIAGGGGPQAFAQGADAVRRAWSDAGKAGQPRLVALGYYALGPDARQAADRYLGDYYAFLGEYAEQVAQSALVTEGAVRGAVAAFADAGCDELILFPCSPEVQQVRLLADAALQ